MTPPGGDIVGPIPPGRDPDEYDKLRRRVLWSLPTGLYVLGTRAGSRRNLMTVSWVTQVAQVPKLIGVGVEIGARTHELIVEGGVFALSLLARRDRALVRRFVKPVEDADVEEETGVGTMNGSAVRPASTGAPILDVAVGWLDCEVRHTLALGSHSWFVGEVVDVGPAEPGTPPDGSPDGDGGILRMEDTRMNYGG
ncbi:MAG TPA: flavin reductase family protein [Acidimicrobiales bacterium]|nr:flavin reductase family protein [Acidimicrobiales bacterium]